LQLQLIKGPIKNIGKEVTVKKFLVLLLVVGFAVGIVLISNDVLFAKEKKEKASEAKVEEAAKTPEPKVVCKFKNDEEMTAFEQLYVSKQATFGRMGVLQAYFAMEQNNLAEIDKQMEEKFGFKMDINKMYDLNRDTKEIREIGPVAPPQPLPTE
jgi:hypothetical protein